MNKKIVTISLLLLPLTVITSQNEGRYRTIHFCSNAAQLVEIATSGPVFNFDPIQTTRVTPELRLSWRSDALQEAFSVEHSRAPLSTNHFDTIMQLSYDELEDDQFPNLVQLHNQLTDNQFSILMGRLGSNPNQLRMQLSTLTDSLESNPNQLPVDQLISSAQLERPDKPEIPVTRYSLFEGALRRQYPQPPVPLSTHHFNFIAELSEDQLPRRQFSILADLHGAMTVIEFAILMQHLESNPHQASTQISTVVHQLESDYMTAVSMDTVIGLVLTELGSQQELE